MYFRWAAKIVRSTGAQESLPKMRSASGKDDGAASSLIEQPKLIAWNPRWVGTLRGKSSRPGEQPMTVETMDDLFLETLKDIYYAEKHIVKPFRPWSRRQVTASSRMH
jgi:hypothetical protein